MKDKKRTPGRPPALLNPVTQNVTLEDYQKKYCKDSELGISGYIRHLIDEDMKNKNILI
jgi:hypothetical protein